MLQNECRKSSDGKAFPRDPLVQIPKLEGFTPLPRFSGGDGLPH